MHVIGSNMMHVSGGNQKQWVKLIFWLTLLLTASDTNAETPLLAATANWKPFAYYQDQSSNNDIPQISGVAVFISKRILAASKIPATFQIYPTNRLNYLLHRGVVDINFADSPVWNNENTKSAFLFSKPYMDVKEYLYFLKSSHKKTKDLKHFEKADIGIALGYYYALLDPKFKSGQLKKIEIRDGLKLLDMLAFKRVDAVAMDNITFHFVIRKEKLDPDLFYRGPQLSNAPLGFKIQKRLGHLLPVINRTIRRMQKRHEIDSIIKQSIIQ